MQISPNSDPGDCLLDILVMTGPKSDSFTTLPKVYKGAHLPHRNIAELRAAQLSIERAGRTSRSRRTARCWAGVDSPPRSGSFPARSG